MGILLLFFDGVGIGRADSGTNPITRYPGEPFPVGDSDGSMAEGVVIPTDATLGVSGIPQSATGQATILTGRNAAAIQGRHVNAFPSKALRTLLTAHSVLRRIHTQGKHPVFANAYHPRYFARRHSRYSVSTWSWMAAGIPYRTLDDLHRGEAVSHDLTNRFLKRLGFEVPLRRPAQAGRILASMTERFDFTFFEYILTDVLGHRQNYDAAVEHLAQIREMMEVLLETIKLDRHQVMLVSDHGNLEDLSTNTHTKNRVPTILWGNQTSRITGNISTLMDITPAILSILFPDDPRNESSSLH